MRNAFLKALGVGGVVVGMTAYLASAQPAGKTLIPLDVGDPIAGSTTIAGGKITVVGSGADIWGAADAFHYAYFKQTGDFDYVVQVLSLVGNSGDGGWSKAELMARLPDALLSPDAPTASDPHISNMANRPTADVANGAPAGVNNRGPQWRAHRTGDLQPDGVSTWAGNSSWTAPNPAYPPQPPNQWLRLERVGSVIYMYTSNDGTAWNMYNPYSPQGWDTAGSWPLGADSAAESQFYEAWPATIFVGLAVTAHSGADLTTAVFTNFVAYTPVPISITTQPPAAINASANSTLTFSVAATGDPVHYQWRKDGVALTTNQVNATFSKPLCQVSDSGTYTCRVFGGGTEIISSNCVVVITVDTTPPTITEVKPVGSQTIVKVTFSEPVTPATANVATNYTLSGGVSVTAAAASADGFSVTLTTSQQAQNTQYTLTINNVKDTAGLSIAANSTATFTSVSLLAGYAYYERWDDANGDIGTVDDLAAAILDGTLRAPDVTSMVNQFGGPWGATDNYNARVRTFFTPPSNGNYVFFVSADDGARVFLSTDETPANKKLICQEAGWSNQYQWTAPGSGALEDKRSDLFALTEWAGGNTITLQGGKKYFMEALVNEGGGGDGVDVTFIKEGEADPANSTDGMFMRGSVISWYESVDTLPPVIVTHPTNDVTILAGGTATLSVVATNPGAAALTYQWQKNGKDIAGATSADYVIANASPLDIGQYWVKVSNPKASVTSGQGTPNPTVVLVTATGVYNIEAEDFDYASGQTKPEASVMPYVGGAYTGLNDSVFDVDYHNTDIQDSIAYRAFPAGQNADNSSETGGQWTMTRAGEWTMTANYKIGWIAAGDWGNYTRTFPTPAKTYYVFAAQSNDTVANGGLDSNLGFVTAGVGTTTQTIENVGTFNSVGSGDWSRNNLVAMTDGAGGAVKTVEIGGTKTIRWNYNNGDSDYLLFIPASATPPGPVITGITKNTDGTLTVAWTGGGVLQVTPSLKTAPIQWTDVGATSPYTFTPQAGQLEMFGRIIVRP